MTTEMFFLLIQLWVGAYLTACLSALLDVCMKPGNIFQFYKVLLAKIVIRKNFPAGTLEGIEKMFSKEIPEGLSDSHVRRWNTERERKKARNEYLISHADESAYWVKPFGYCAVCFNVWLAFASIWLTGLPYSAMQNHYWLWVFIAYPALSNRYLRKILHELN